MKTAILLSSFLVLAFVQAHAQSGAVAICPQGAENTQEVFHSNSLIIDDVEVDTSYGSSEPNFSTEVQWLENGNVLLARRGKPAILLGNGSRPEKTAGCLNAPFEVDSSLKVRANKEAGFPYPVCNIDSGCRIVRSINSSIDILIGNEQIHFEGRTVSQK